MQTNINPVAWKMNAPQANLLTVQLVSDDLSSKAVLLWQLSASTPATPTAKAAIVTVDRGNVAITGTDYANWTGDNAFPITFTLQQLGLTAATPAS